MKTDAQDAVAELHAAYVQETGYNIPMTMDRESAWFEWVRKGYSVSDLVALIRHHKLMARNGLPARSLKFRSLVVNIDYAEEDLAELRARGRVKPPHPNRDEVLKATGRMPPDGAPEPVYAKPTADIIAQLRKAAGLE